MTEKQSNPAIEMTTTTDGPVVCKPEWTQTRTVVRMLFIVLVAAVALWMLHALRGVLLMLVLAIFFSYLVTPW